MRLRSTIWLAALIAVSACPGPGTAQQSTDTGNKRIGVYDSRAIAVAYAGSAFQEKAMKDLKEQHRKAKSAKDSKEVARLEAVGKGWQDALHKQGFGTAPVEDLLAHIASELPRIQKAAGVSDLISKWNQRELAKHPNVEHVDVTMQLVDAFHPSDLQRRRAIEIQRKLPLKSGQ